MFCRLKIKQVMILIVLLGILLGLDRMGQRSMTFRSLAQYHAAMIQSLNDSNLPYSEHAWLTGKSSLSRSEIAAFERTRNALIRYHEALYKKYKYAASHPWIFISPDPVPPE